MSMEFAAHINGEKIQTVDEHCRNTADICSEYAGKIGAENTGRLQGLLHDAGKLTYEFNDYIRGKNNISRGGIDHSYAGAKYLTDLADPEKHQNVSQLVSRTIISHHGINDWVDDKCNDYFSCRISKNDGYETVKQNINRIKDENELAELLDKAAEEYKFLRRRIRDISKSKEDFAFYLGMLERFLQSSLIDADRSDTARFMNQTPVQSDIELSSLWKNMYQRMEEKLQSFGEKTDVISQRRKIISDKCAEFAQNDVDVCRLIVPTGGGKTLSSLRFAIKYCIGHEMEKIVYIAPFMSILEQNSDEFRNIAGDEAFTEHHSNALAELDSENEYREYELHSERWDSPVIATTMVQFLNTLFSAKTSSVRRMHRLGKAVIIIDEVQSIPLKCVNIFNLAVNFLSKICKATVVLCSATQPVNEETAYPILLDEKSSMTGDYKDDFEIFKRSEIVSCIDPYGFSYEQTADFCGEKFSQWGNLLVVVNTKAAASELYRMLLNKYGEKTQVIHLSTNMCPQHRKDKLDAIRKLLYEKKPVICVTTQLIEAGVDISFRCVVRSAAGLDNAVQAAGRCNRHGEEQKVCPVYLIKINEEKLGNLREISVAQQITQQMLDSGKYSDFQSVDAVSDFFRKLYESENKELSYRVDDGGCSTTLLNLLSLNKERYEISLKTSSIYGSQAFKTAGTLFKVIDNNTTDLIVPYNDEAKELISRLEKPDENYTLLLRKLQRYTVSIYSGTRNKLADEQAFRVLDCGAVILDNVYYDDAVGVKLEGAEKEVLLY